MLQDIKIVKVSFFFLLCLFANLVFPHRVVSMAPALTEIVFALGKGNTLVGVTKFCDYPPVARKISKIGGFLDVNIEALLSLSPDIVIAYPEQYSQVKALKPHVIVLIVKHQCLSDLYHSISAIGRVLQAEKEAHNLLLSIQNKLATIRKLVGGRTKMRTLIIAGRNADELKNMYIIGKEDFLNEILEIAGGINAYQGTIHYPNISMETVVFLNPDFIFEISAHYEGISDEKVFELWRPFQMLHAVQKQQIKIIKNSFWLRPGSRVVLIAEEMAGIFSSAISFKKSVYGE